MHSALRITALRVAALAGLGASAAIQADAVQPGRKFCPLEEACDRAHQSALGSLFGLPTSLLGMAAFALLFSVTMFPVEVSRRLTRLMGLVAAAGAIGFVAYQAMVLGSFCPLCLVADGAGLLAGVVALTWPPLPQRRSGRWLAAESGGSRLWWGTAAVVVLGLPFAWPREQAPAWVEAPSLDLEDAVASTASTEPAPAPEGDVAAPSRADLPPPAHAPVLPPTSAGSSPPGALAAPEQRAFSVRAATPEPRAAVPSRPVPAAAAARAPSPAPLSPALPLPSAPAPTPVVLVEYLNAFCPHCRATYERLERVIAGLRVPLRRHRIYTWASDDYPLWARACAYAETVGLEVRTFEELLRARDPGMAEVRAAGMRAGLDVVALDRALRDPMPPERLLRDRRVGRSARLQGLPTLDVGRRRLMGEASEAELRDALLVAAAQPPR